MTHSLLFTLERIWVCKGREREQGDGQGRDREVGGTDTNFITSFLSIYFFSWISIVKATADRRGSWGRGAMKTYCTIIVHENTTLQKLLSDGMFVVHFCLKWQYGLTPAFPGQGLLNKPACFDPKWGCTLISHTLQTPGFLRISGHGCVVAHGSIYKTSSCLRHRLSLCQNSTLTPACSALLIISPVVRSIMHFCMTDGCAGFKQEAWLAVSQSL